MAISTQIRSTRNAGTPITGFRSDLVIGDTVGLLLTSTVGVVTFRWELVGRPEGSAAGGAGPEPIVLSTTATAAFVVDNDVPHRRDGTYVVQCILNEGTPSETRVRTILSRLTGLSTSDGRNLRKLGGFEALEDTSIPSIMQGWATMLNRWFDYVREVGTGGGTQTLAVSYTSGTVSADQTLVLTDADGGGLLIDATGGGFTGASALRVNTAAGSPVVVSRANGRLGLGTATPAQNVHAVSASPALRLERTGNVPIDIQNVADELQFVNANTARILARFPPSGGARSDFGLASGTTPANFPVISLGAASTAPVSLASEGRIRFNESTNKLQYSVNTGSWTDFAAVTGAYTTVDANGTPVTQRAILNFSSEFTVVDNGGATRTDVSLGASGVSANTYDRVAVNTAGRVTTGYAEVVANITALEALVGANYRDGSIVRVQTLERDFILHTASSATVDHIEVASVSGAAGARWISTFWASKHWWNVTAWWVDPANVSGLASDQNTGQSSVLPLLSFRELARRLNGGNLPSGTINVTLMSNTPAADVFHLRDATSDGFVNIVITGTPTVIASGRTISTPRNPALTANDHFEITDAAGVSGFVQNYLMHRTNSTGAWWWGYKDLGTNKLHISPPLNANSGTIVTLSNGDTYEALSLPDFADAWVEPNLSLFLQVQVTQVRFIGASFYGASGAVGGIIYDRSIIANQFSGAFGGTDIAANVLKNVCVPASANGFDMLGATAIFGGLLAGNGTTTAYTFHGGYMLGGNSANVVTLGGATLSIIHDARFEKAQFMIYDWAGSDGAVITRLNSYLYALGIGGERNTGQLMRVDQGGRACGDGFSNWNSAITSHGTPYQVNGTGYTAADLGIGTNHLATRGGGIIDQSAGAWSNDLSGVGVNPSVVAIHETGGPTRLPFAAVPASTILQRNGSSQIVGSNTVASLSITALTAGGFVSATAATGALTVSSTIPAASVTGLFYQTLKDSSGSAQTQRANLKFAARFALTDVAPDSVVDLATTAVTPGSYTAANITVDAFGRITAAASGGGGSVTNVTATLPLTSTGGATPNIALNFDNVSITLSGAGGTPIQRAALTGDVTAAAGSNATTIAANAVTDAKLRQSAGLSVIGRSSNSTGNVADITASTNGDVLRMAGGVLGWGAIPESSVTNLVTDLAGKAPVGATYITQTPDGTLTNEQALSALSSGMLSSVTGTGVVSSTAFTASRLAFGSGTNGTLTESANLTYSTTDVLTLASSDSNTFSMALTKAGAQTIEKRGSGTFFVGTLGAQDFSVYTNNTTRLAIASTGGVTLSSLGSGLVKSTSGLLSNATANVDYVATSRAINTTSPLTGGGDLSADRTLGLTTPSSSRVLAGTGTGFASTDEIRLDTATTDSLMASNDGAIIWRNLSGGTMIGATNYEQVRSFWSANVWNLKSEKAGTGTTVRAMTIDADTAALTLNGTPVSVGGVSFSVNVSSQVLLLAGSSVALGASVPGSATPSLTATSARINFSTANTAPSSASLVLDTYLFDGQEAVITGTAHITTATGLNAVAFNVPAFNGNAQAKTVDYAATVAIYGAPLGTNSLTLANRYALWVQNDTTRIDGPLRIDATNGFGMGVTPISRRNITGSRGGNVALANLLTALEQYGLLDNNTTA